MTADQVSEAEFMEELEDAEGDLICPHCEKPIRDADETLADELGIFHHRRCLEVKMDLPHTDDLVERRSNGNGFDLGESQWRAGDDPW